MPIKQQGEIPKESQFLFKGYHHALHFRQSGCMSATDMAVDSWLLNAVIGGLVLCLWRRECGPFNMWLETETFA